jgi:hypothetical protein
MNYQFIGGYRYYTDGLDEGSAFLAMIVSSEPIAAEIANRRARLVNIQEKAQNATQVNYK